MTSCVVGSHAVDEREGDSNPSTAAARPAFRRRPALGAHPGARRVRELGADRAPGPGQAEAAAVAVAGRARGARTADGERRPRLQQPAFGDHGLRERDRHRRRGRPARAGRGDQRGGQARRRAEPRPAGGGAGVHGRRAAHDARGARSRGGDPLLAEADRTGARTGHRARLQLRGGPSPGRLRRRRPRAGPAQPRSQRPRRVAGGRSRGDRNRRSSRCRPATAVWGPAGTCRSASAIPGRG